MKHNIYKLRILSIDYSSYNGKTVCEIKYINPISGNACISKGVAKCDPNDSNKLIIGQRIAEGRAKHNMYMRYIKKIHSVYLSIVGKYNKLAKRELEHLGSIINSL